MSVASGPESKKERLAGAWNHAKRPKTKGENVFTFQSIYKAYRSCRKNKRNTINALQFEHNLLENLWDLTHALQNRSYQPGTSICFLASSPKMREVFAADFRDRVVHHLLIDAIEAMYEKKFIYDVYNNRKHKGTHQAVKRVAGWMRSDPGGYYLQLDIRGFFYHLHKEILYKQLDTDIRKSTLPHQEDILWLSHTIIYHDPTQNYVFKGDARRLQTLPPHKTLFKIPPHRGLPIGNLTSQFFANVYMNRFDHFAKRELKVKRYVRYVDDFVLFDQSRERLKGIHAEIARYLNKELHLSLREDSRLGRNAEGLDFLGYIIRPHYTLVRQRVVNNYKRKKAQFLQNYEAQKGHMSLAEIKRFLSVQASFASHIKHANSYNLYQKTGVIHETNPFDYDRA